MGILDVPGISQKKADARYARPQHAYPKEMPAGLGWDLLSFPITVALIQSFGMGPQYGTINFTPEQLFGLKSTAFSNPAFTFYATPTGSDTNPGTEASPVKTGGKLITLANATGLPCKLVMDGGSSPSSAYPRTSNLRSAGVAPTVDVAIVARGGRVSLGTYDNFSAPALDGTYTNCYNIPSSGTCDRVVDRWQLDRYGDFVALKNVATAAICNVTPGSWTVSGSVLYVNRADGLAVTNANTRAYRGSAANFIMTTQVNVGFFAEDGNSGFDIEGSNANGVIDFLITAPGATGCSVFSHCRFLQAGGLINTAARAISINSFNGLVAFFNCSGSGAQTDIYNFHNNYGAAKAACLLVNCTSPGTGKNGNQSCNAFTMHEDCIGIAVAGYLREGHGGTMRHINTSRCWVVGTDIGNDLGDAVLGGGGSFQPAAVVANDTAIIWADSVTIDMPGGTRAWVTSVAAGAQILRRDCRPVAQPDAGGGTFGSY
jgi:hypothetical protein